MPPSPPPQTLAQKRDESLRLCRQQAGFGDGIAGIGMPCHSDMMRHNFPLASSSATISSGIRMMPMSSVARRRIMPTLLSVKRPPTGTVSLCFPS